MGHTWGKKLNTRGIVGANTVGAQSRQKTDLKHSLSKLNILGAQLWHIFTPSVPRVYPKCAPSVPQVCPECTPSVPRVYPKCASSVPQVYPKCAPSVPQVYPECAPSVCPECALLDYQIVDVAILINEKELEVSLGVCQLFSGQFTCLNEILSV